MEASSATVIDLTLDSDDEVTSANLLTPGQGEDTLINLESSGSEAGEDDNVQSVASTG